MTPDPMLDLPTMGISPLYHHGHVKATLTTVTYSHNSGSFYGGTVAYVGCENVNPYTCGKTEKGSLSPGV